VGFLDDNPGKKGLSLNGVPLLGNIDLLPQTAQENQVGRIFMVMPSASGSRQIQRVVELCETSGVEYKILPGLSEMVDGAVSLKTLRDVNYENLLRHPPMVLDDRGISSYLEGKTVLVTGAGGSIGSELCRQIVKFKPALLFFLDSSEFDLYTVDNYFKENAAGVEVNTLLGWAHNQELVDRIFQTFHPEVVFHAAAFNHLHCESAIHGNGEQQHCVHQGVARGRRGQTNRTVCAGIYG
jgi:FlaA1/EpsC-like NDP-sugar epimerase